MYGAVQGGNQIGAVPFELLRACMGEIRPNAPDIPFSGGALGYWGYDLVRSLGAMGDLGREAEATPEMMVGLYDWSVVIDHKDKKAALVSSLSQPETEAMLPGLHAKLATAVAHPERAFHVSGRVSSNLTGAQYLNAFNRVMHYLKTGDCYQVNLSQRFEAAAKGDAYAAYRYLRQTAPAPYSAFLDFPGMQVLSASPERFLKLQSGHVETRPIKGTRPRVSDLRRDLELRNDLANNSKDRAENLMIVDLLRNDLGKCCIAGSITAPELFKVESHSNVHHLVSTVTGVLAPGHDALSLLQACFPGGSITGAPKLRAMQIIEELEPNRRGIYCGTIGYIGFDGNMDSNIVIRTLVHAGGRIYGWAGGGIVADSEAEAEYRETFDKASAMLALFEHFGAEPGETPLAS